MIIGIHVVLNFPFGVYGAVTGGFQRYDINNLVAIVTSLAAAAVNVAVVLAGYDLVYLVAATTAVRMSAYLMYRINAYRVFPELHITPRLFRLSRLKEVMGFSVYMTVIDWANRLNYQLDELVIGAFLGPRGGGGVGARRADRLGRAAAHQPGQRRAVPVDRRQRYDQSAEAAAADPARRHAPVAGRWWCRWRRRFSSWPAP